MAYQWIFESKVFDNINTYILVHLNTGEQFFCECHNLNIEMLHL